MPTNDLPQISQPTIPTLALRPIDAARALGISPRLLWSLTSSGQIPCVRLNSCVVYPIETLQAWLRVKAGAKGAE